MTGYSVPALEKLKKDIAKAAIKWTLYDEPVKWDGDADSGFYGAGWDGNLPPVSGPTGTIKLKYYPPTLGFAAGQPPGAEVIGDGTGPSGPYYEYEIDPWTAIYEPWIERIEQAFAGWDSIPEPGDFSDPISDIQAAVTMLTPVPTGESGNDPNGDMATTYNDVELEASLGTMQSFMGSGTDGAEQGLLIYAFVQGYGPSRIRAVMGNQAQAAIVLGVSMLGEQKIWEKAQIDIMAIAEGAKDSFRPGGGGGGTAVDLKVVKAFADLLGTFTPPPVKAVLATGSAALSFVDELMPQDTGGDPGISFEGWTPDEVYNSLVDGIKKLEQKVFDQEYELAYTTLQKLIDYMHDGKASQFHIHPEGGIDSDLAEAPALSVHPEYLRKVGYQLVPGIAAYMGHAAENAQSANQPGLWVRANQIGLGSNGPYAKWSEAQGLFDAVTTGSGKELVEAGVVLAVGAGFIEDTDGDSQQSLKGVEDDLNRGELGWDNSVPQVPTGPSYGGRPV